MLMRFAGALKERIKDIVANENTKENISNIVEAIKIHKIKNVTDLIQYGLENGGIKQIRSLQFLLFKAIEENKNLFLKGDKTNFSKNNIDNKN